MSKLNFGQGTVVPPEWFNSLQDIHFDGVDLDGHYPRLSDDSLSTEPGNIKPEWHQFRDAFKVTRDGSTNNYFVAPGRVSNGRGELVEWSSPNPITVVPPTNAPRKFIYITAEDSSPAVRVSVGDYETIPPGGLAIAYINADGSWEDIRPRGRTLSTNYGNTPTQPGGSNTSVPIGSLLLWLTDTAPAGWLICDGSIYPTVDYPELFSLIGYSYGGVDEYFQIPDFKGRFPIGKSDTLPGATALADVGGNYEIALNFDHLPNHSHTVTDPGHSHRLYGGTDTDFEEELVDALSDNTIGGPAGVAGEQGGNKGYVSTNSANTKFVENSLSNITLQSTGQSEPFNILPPFLTINFIIYAGKNV